MNNPAKIIQASGLFNASSRIERTLLSMAALFLALNLLALSLVRGMQYNDWMIFIAWAGASLGGLYVLSRYLPKRDPLLFPLTMFLTGWGLVIIDRLSENYIYNFGNRQLVWMIVGLVLMLIIAIRPEPLQWLREYRYLMLLFGLLLLGTTILFGRNPTGSAFAPQLWLGIGNLYFQPSEFLKIVLIGFLSSYLAEQYPALRADKLNEPNPKPEFKLPSPRIMGPILLMWGVAIVFLIWQRDLGTASIFFGVFIILLYVASSNPMILLSGGALLIVGGVLGYALFDVVQLRVDIWLNPWPEADRNAYQIVQSLLAFAAGGIFGQGIGQGAPNYIPVVHSDFVFAALAEEWGLLGVIVVVICLLTIIMRGLRIAILQQDRPFFALFAVGISALIAVQSLLIMGGTLRLLPLTGVTLPFLSYGGSSLVTSYLMIGFLLRLSVQQGKRQ